MIVKSGKGKRYIQNEIHQKYYFPRSKENNRSSKILWNVKDPHQTQTNKDTKHENSQTRIKPEVITQPINEMRILIQEIKTIIRTVTENKQTPKIHQTKRHKQIQTKRT